ncbi:MAG TPA: phosphate ABC transporter permease subunit PstC [Aggregatilineaceae bacterium]|nr:phosphate ABC transporter permease subunit PstC [Aggregatilineaceae bacterium]
MESIRLQMLVDRVGLRRMVSRHQNRSWRWWKDWIAGRTMGLLTVAASLLIVVMVTMLLDRARPILASNSISSLVQGEVWKPRQGLFGFWPFITGSVLVTLLAMLLSVPTALLSAIYLADYSRSRAIIKPLVDLLASIPSVIYGLWGVLFVVPLVRDHISPWADRTLGDHWSIFQNTNPTGFGLLAAGFVLAIMTFPIIVAVSEEVLRSVPQGMREASLSLGATDWETTKLVVLRKAAPGLIAAVVLGFSRAFGETLAVAMVVGNRVKVPETLFDPAYPLPALIANNYGEMMSIPLYDSALMTAALMLLFVVLLFNVGARSILGRLNREQTT